MLQVHGVPEHIYRRPGRLTILMGILINNSRPIDMRTHMDSRFNQVDRRFDEMKDLWRSEIHRVEEVIGARLKHLEGR